VNELLPFTISLGASRNVVVLDHRVTGSDWEQWYLLRSDAHWDNPDSNQDLQKQHLDEAINPVEVPGREYDS